MLTDLQRRVDKLDRTRDAFVASIRAASDRQRAFHPALGVWSMLEVTEHLVLAEEKSLLGMLKGAPAGTTVTVAAHVRMLLVRLVLHTSIRVKVPVSRVVPEGVATLAELEERWATAGRGLVSALASIGPAETGAARFRHPIAGWVTAAEGVAFHADHIDHHARQVGRIQRSEGYPPA